MSRRPPADLNIVAAFYKRWSPHEDKRREIADDHKEMFAEAKKNGLNPKALRKAFAEQYRVENQTTDQAEKRAETDGDFELYLTALARVREADEEFDPETGEIKSPTTNGGDSETSAADPVIARRRLNDSALSGAQADEHQHPQEETHIAPVESAADEISTTIPENVSVQEALPATGGPLDARESIPQPVGHQPAEGNTPTSAGHGDRGAVVPSAASVVVSNVLHLRTHNPETHFLNSDGLPRLHGCLKADRCAGTWRALCFDCSRLHDGPTAQPGAA